MSPSAVARQAASFQAAAATRKGGKPPVAVWLPAAVVGAAMLLPLAYLVVRMLGAGEEAWRLLLRERTLQVLGRTVILALAVTAAAVALGLPLAWLTARTDLPARRLWAVLTALPLVVPSYVAGFIVVVALGPRGMMQQALDGILGVDRLPSIYGFPGAMATLALLTYPYVLLPVRAALTRMDPALEEAARSLGDGAWVTFRRVVLPQLRPAIGAGGALVALYTMSDFGAVSLLRYETFTWAIYIQYETAFDRSVAAALSLVLAAMAAMVLVLEAQTRGRARYHLSGASAGRPARVLHLRRWKWPAVAFCSIGATLALLLPIGVLSYWLVRGLTAGESLGPLWAAAWNSVHVSLLAAAVATACAIPVSVTIVRFPGAFGWLLERASHMGFALPGVVVALSLVFFATSALRPAYQTTGLLIFAYVVLFFPAVLGALRSAMLQVNPRLEEAARTLGRNTVQTLVSVTLPLMRPGLVAGAALVFLLTMKELPATLILSPIGFKTLATSTWSAASEAFFARAAAPGLLAILASSAPMAFFVVMSPRSVLAKNW